MFWVKSENQKLIYKLQIVFFKILLYIFNCILYKYIKFVTIRILNCVDKEILLLI